MDTRKGHDGDQDGVRIFEHGGNKRFAVARVVIAILVTAVVVIVAGSATAVLFLRRDGGARPDSPLSTVPAPPREVVTQKAAPYEAARQEAAPQEIATQPLAPPILRKITPVVDVPPATKPAQRGRSARTINGRAETASAPERGQVAEHKPSAVEEQERQVDSMARDFVDGLRASGETRGLAAFPPAGTNPVKRGLVVPDDFELPPGYVRHYQTTDDGQPLEPILMFSPDYQLVDANGAAVPAPKDGIVPPEMAPPGLPLRTLEVPKTPHADGR